MNHQNCCVAGFYVRLNPETLSLPLAQDELLNLSRAFRSFPRNKALKVIFRLFYSTLSKKREAISWFRPNVGGKNIFYYEYLDKILNFTNEEFCLLGKELLYQYRENDSSFLDIQTIRGIPDNCEKELSVLEETLAEHPVLLFRTVEKCVLAHKKENLVSRCVVLLLSGNNISQTIGLETLGFNFEYRILLFPFVKQIATLLLAMHKSVLNKQKLLSSQDGLALPLIESLKQMNAIKHELNNLQEELLNKEDDKQEKQDDSYEQHEINNSDEISIFEKELLNFIETLENPSDLLVNHQQKLIILANSIITLLYAKLEYSKLDLEIANDICKSTGERYLGILFAAATNIQLAKQIINCEQSKNLAMANFFSALHDLKKIL